MSNETLALAFEQLVTGTSVEFTVGTVAEPGMKFVGNETTGLSIPTSNELVASANSVESIRFTETDVQFPLPITLIDHAGVSPSVATLGCIYKKAGDDGIYWNTQGTGEVNLISAHAWPILATDSAGATATPSYSFSADPDTGMYLSAVGTLSLAVGAVDVLSLDSQHIKIGTLAGSTSQGLYATAIGYQAGVIQQDYALAIGFQAGYTNQGYASIAIGKSTSYITSGLGNISIGTNTGYNGSGEYSVLIGTDAGYSSTGNDNSVTIGTSAGHTNQSPNTTAIGYFSAYTTQGTNGLAVGYQAGYTTQGSYATAIGYQAGLTAQGNYAIAIGWQSGLTNQGANSITINASGVTLNNTVANSLVIAPIRNENTPLTALVYNTTTKEVSYSTSGTKTFIIDHPNDSNKYLVHACLEGPEAGVYYRGTSSIPINSTSVFIPLPAYTSKWTNWTISLNSIGMIPDMFSYKLANNGFIVYGTHSGDFNWSAFAKRSNVDIEPNRADVTLSGISPYQTLKYNNKK